MAHVELWRRLLLEPVWNDYYYYCFFFCCGENNNNNNNGHTGTQFNKCFENF